MSRHQIHVATPFLPTVGFPGRDAKLQVATSHTAAYVATSKMMSRHQLSSAPFLLHRDAIFPCRDLPCCHPCRDLKMMSRHQAQPSQVVTSKPGRDQPLFPLHNALVATSKTLVATPNLLSPIQPSRDVHFLVATSCPTKPSRDLKSMSRPQQVLTHNDFFFLFLHLVAFLPATPLMQ